MSFFVSDAEWAQYALDLNSFMNEDAALQPIFWHRSVRSLDTDGDDDKMLNDTIEIQGLIQYNDFRSWPINSDTTSGTIDKESCLLLLNKEYLRGLGYLNSYNQFTFDPALDTFTVDGVLYRNKGESSTSQAKDSSLLIFIVLKREKLDSPDDRYADN